MKNVLEIMKKRATQLLESGEVNRILGWAKGDFIFDQSPATFNSVDELDDLVYDNFSSPNLSKYLIEESKKEGKIAVFLKPCDTFSFNQLIKENRVKREKIYVLGVECGGKIDVEKLKAEGVKGIKTVIDNGENITVFASNGEFTFNKGKVLLEKCLSCKGKEHKIFDELIIVNPVNPTLNDRFDLVRKVEAMSAEERFAFFRKELSKCIRCNACRNVCPACSCVKCIFDNNNSGVASKASPDTFEEQMYHIIRAFHVAGRCTDCGECSRVCPQGIPLHLLNRKLIKDMNEFYGEYQAGEDAETKGPLTNYKKEDVEPNVISDKGGDM